MSDQFSLLGGDPTPTDRLFFGFYPDAEAAAKIEQLAKRSQLKFGCSGAPLLADRFHITLHHVGDYDGLPNGHVEAAVRAASTLDASAFDVTFDRIGSFASERSNHPFVLQGSAEGLEALNSFRVAFGRAWAWAKVGRRVSTQFTPHVTLLYDRKSMAEQMIEPISWRVRELVLVHSLLGQTRHIALKRWALKD